LADAQRRWLAAGCVPGAGTRYAEMARTALLDLATLTGASGGTVAAVHPSWRYVWPRDASFVAAALAAAGHPQDAVRQLAFLQSVQGGDGRFEARYRADGNGVPDDRGHQLDSTGWVLWGLDASVAVMSPDQRVEALGRLRPLLDRSTTAALAATGDGRVLPPASPDYRELAEDEVTLGTVAPLLAGLQAAQRLYAGLGEAGAARSAGDAARRFELTVHAAFGPGGYQLHQNSGGADASRRRPGRTSSGPSRAPPGCSPGRRAGWPQVAAGAAAGRAGRRRRHCSATPPRPSATATRPVHGWPGSTRTAPRSARCRRRSSTPARRRLSRRWPGRRRSSCSPWSSPPCGSPPTALGEDPGVSR
jgi:hypothetical protein